MAFPKKYLNDSEEVIRDLRPHWFFLFGPAVTLIAALALWRYCEDSARYTFGDAFVSPAAEKLLEAVRATPDGLTRTQITTGVFGGHKKRPEINGLLSEMLTEGLIHRTKVKPETGRPTEVWRAGRGPGNQAAN